MLKQNLTEANKKSPNQSKNDQMIWSQISADGLGKDLWLEASQNGGNIKLRNLVEFICYQQSGFNIIQSLTGDFDMVEILEQYGGYYRFRTPKQDKTIGSIFAMIEGKKEDFKISEYAVSQTTLEQIFQTFANTSIEDKAFLTFSQNENGDLTLLNPDRKSMFVQKRKVAATPDISNNFVGQVESPDNLLVAPE